MIRSSDLDELLIRELPELAEDRVTFQQRRDDDPEFTQTFFSYSFIPTLQSALDRKVEDFCRRAFALIERLVQEGDADVQRLLREEFFDYGPVCDKWMKKAEAWMGPDTKGSASAIRD